MSNKKQTRKKIRVDNYVLKNIIDKECDKDECLDFIIKFALSKKKFILRKIYYFYIVHLIKNILKEKLSNQSSINDLKLKVHDVSSSSYFCDINCINKIANYVISTHSLFSLKKKTKNAKKNKRKYIKKIRSRLDKYLHEEYKNIRYRFNKLDSPMGEYNSKYDWFDFIESELKIIELIHKMNHGLKLIYNSGEKNNELYEILKITDESYIRTIYATMDNYSKYFSRVTLKTPYLFIIETINQCIDIKESLSKKIDDSIKYLTFDFYQNTIFNINKIIFILFMYYNFDENHPLYNKLVGDGRIEEITSIIKDRNKIAHLNTMLFDNFESEDSNETAKNINVIIELFSELDNDFSVNDSYYADKVFDGIMELSKKIILIDSITDNKNIIFKHKKCICEEWMDF